MKVDIAHDTFTTGLFKKRTWYRVTLKVQLTEEEKAIIKQRQLKETIIIKRGFPVRCELQGDCHLMFRDLVSGKDEYDFPTLEDAKAYHALLVERLKQAREYPARSAEKPEDTSFEL